MKAYEADAIVLAAGRGARLGAGVAKPLVEVAHRSLLGWVLETARARCSRVVVVVRSAGDAVADEARAQGCLVAEQPEALGTGDAARRGLAALAGGRDSERKVFVLLADTPLLAPETLDALVAAMEDASAALALGGITAQDAIFADYGRLVLAADGAVRAVIEARDAEATEARDASPRNLGVLLSRAGVLASLLAEVAPSQATEEHYLTALPALAWARGLGTAWVVCPPEEALGVNTPADLARVEAAAQARLRVRALAAGALLTAPDSVYFAWDTWLAPGARVDPHVVFGPGARLESGAWARAFSHIEGATLASGAVAGPFARLRSGARLGRDARAGSFVEAKNASLGVGTKASHLAYLGDVTIGDGANIGAGTITCNWDGEKKSHTDIGAGAFVGSNVALVAPVAVGAGAKVGAGSVITDSVPDGALVVARVRQAPRKRG